jgi:hypothetical protein
VQKKNKHQEEIDAYLNIVDTIKDINVESESKKIISNPRQYFNKYLKDIDGWILVMAKIEIYLKAREVDQYGSNTKESAIGFVKEISVSGYLDVLKNFYKYALEMINFILNESSNVMLDSYNDKKINDFLLNKIMPCINSVKEMALKDKKDIEEAIHEADEEQTRIDEDTSRSSGFFGIKF